MSLIEASLSIVIISSAAAMAVPALIKTQEDYVLTSAARDVATKMHFARVRAISRNVDCRLRVISTKSYAVECEDPLWALVSSMVLPRGITIVANARPEFHPLGTVSPTATVTLWNASGRQRKVIVNIGGRIRIQ